MKKEYTLADSWNVLIGSDMVWNALLETLIMIGASGAMAIILGVPLGVILNMTDPSGLKPNAFVNKVLGFAVNIGRSIPFIILCIYLMPFTKFLVKSSTGTLGAIPPLAIAAIPFMARLAEVAFKEVPKGLVEAAQAMGASNMQIIRKVLLAESMPALISGITIMLVSLLGYSAIVGAVGAGGLGSLAYNRGYSGFRGDITDAVMIVIIVLVVIMQFFGDRLAIRSNHR